MRSIVLIEIDGLVGALARIHPLRLWGHVVGVNSAALHVEGLGSAARRGDRISVVPQGRPPVSAEIVSIEGPRAQAMWFGSGEGVAGVNTCGGQRLARLGVARQHQRRQQPLCRDKAVARLCRQVFGLGHDAGSVGIEIDLPVATLHLRHLRHGGVDGGFRALGIAACPGDERGCLPLRVVEQGLGDMVRCQALVVLAQRDGLGRLEEAAGAFGKFLEVHENPILRVSAVFLMPVRHISRRLGCRRIRLSACALFLFTDVGAARLARKSVDLRLRRRDAGPPDRRKRPCPAPMP
jgi:hypothetical protein